MSCVDAHCLTVPLRELEEMDDAVLCELFRTTPPLRNPHGIRPDGTGGEAAYMLFRTQDGTLRPHVLLYEAQG